MKNLTYKKILVIACIASILVGVFLHFAYDLSGKNIIIGSITPVNESVWEHLKLLFVPFTLFSIFFYFYTKKKFSNMFLVTFFGNLVGGFVIVTLYYLGTTIFAKDNMVFNIIAYILGIISAYFTLYFGIYSEEFINDTKDSTVLGIAALSILFVLFILNTYFPLRMNLTIDPNTKTYGIFKQV